MDFFPRYEEGQRRRRREEDGRPLQWWESILFDYPRLKSATDEHLLRLFRMHAIDETVGRRRPYTLYAADDWDAVLHADRLYANLSRDQTKATQKKVAQRPGVVMARHGLKRPLFAQYRPFKFEELDFDVAKAYGAKDEGVFTRWSFHDHDEPV